MSNAANEAQVILNQLTQSNNGSRVLQAMVGAKDIGYGTNSDGNTYVTFKFKMSKKSNACTITLTSRDDYDVTFWKIRGLDSNIVKEFENIYAEDLKYIFEEFTELYLTL